jgi:hypothetical protein
LKCDQINFCFVAIVSSIEIGSIVLNYCSPHNLMRGEWLKLGDEHGANLGEHMARYTNLEAHFKMGHRFKELAILSGLYFSF